MTPDGRPSDDVYRRRRRYAAAGLALLVFGAGLAVGLQSNETGEPDGSPVAEGRPAGANGTDGPGADGGASPAGSASTDDGERAPGAGSVAATAGSDAPPWAARRESEPGGERAADGAGDQAASAPDERRTPMVRAASSVTPSVVSIRVIRQRQASRRDFWDLFSYGRDRLTAGLGSGFAIDSTGHVLTNHHVVEGAQRILVADARGQVHAAELVGTDELTDLALLKIPDQRVPPVELGTSSDLMVGEPAMALGNPFGFQLANTEPTVTVGVVSGVGRDIRSRGQRGVLYADMIQTDASINPGNSGGPLVNVEGRVIGVNSSILSESGGSEGIGFAIPIDRALRIADELRRFGRVRQPWVGADVASSAADTFLLRTVVRRVAEGSPAADAGLREGDVLLSAGDNRIDGPMDWEVALLDAGVGSRVAVRYSRDGSARTTRLRVEEPPSERAERVEVLQGLQLVTVTEQIAVERALQVERGALIVDVSDEVARATRMREGDVILAVNRREVATAEDAASLLRGASGRGLVQVYLYRDGSSVITSFGIR